MNGSDSPAPDLPTEISAQPPAPIFSTSTAGPTSPPTLPIIPPTHLGLGVSIQQGGQSTDALVARMTDVHISQVISQAESESSRKHIEMMAWMRLMFAIMVLLVFAIPFLCFLFLWYGKPELLQPIIYTTVGGLGGFGLGRAYQREKDHEKG